MTDSRPIEVTPTDATPSVERLDQLLLDAKLSVPEPRPGSVTRDALIERVRSSGCRVVGVTAPAGYGKSTLLAEWARAEAHMSSGPCGGLRKNWLSATAGTRASPPSMAPPTVPE